MNTKTMRLPPRRISTTIASSNNNNNAPKRKERESNLDAPHAPAKALKLIPPQAEPTAPSPAPISGHLLAGYMAHEFLTKGTLLGQSFTPTARSVSNDPTVAKPPDRRGAEAEAEAEPMYEKVDRYVEVADLLKTEGARLAGIVNPTQLARFLQL